MDDSVARALVDVSGYVGAVSAGYAANALWAGGADLVRRVRQHFTKGEERSIAAIEAGSGARDDVLRVLAAVQRILDDQPSILSETQYVVAPAANVSNSIFVVGSES